MDLFKSLFFFFGSRLPPALLPWLQHHPGPEGAFPHVPDRGAAPAAGGAAGGRIHALHHHKTLRLLPVRHQRHHVTCDPSGKHKQINKQQKPTRCCHFLFGIQELPWQRLDLLDFVILLESDGSDLVFVRILEKCRISIVFRSQTLNVSDGIGHEFTVLLDLNHFYWTRLRTRTCGLPVLVSGPVDGFKAVAVKRSFHHEGFCRLFSGTLSICKL